MPSFSYSFTNATRTCTYALFRNFLVRKLTSVFRFVDAGHDPPPTDGSVLALAVPASWPRFALFFLLPSLLSLGLTLAAAAAAEEPSSQEAVPGSSNGLVRSVRRMIHLGSTVPAQMVDSPVMLLLLLLLLLLT